ncbi:LacI family DNA-binding transcriptional regulator [Gordonia sp. SL306]|uniref:LacI family DNA-binding transcriptional regulator n=1 Tax=Gordonia sp. SL306 TaxID=2995145 RepID=UPI00226F00C1|nr:LacI family DNA-binding transcriptional regulator [Gordonia sp. SL306]WAC56392.1 LacI family DNA-binding transcriptional regulator [Gordonia sp. SL306]
MVERPGRRLTLVDVAQAAGVSKALVSIVMRGVPGASDETRERVLRIADEMGYVPDQRARKLRQSSSRLLGVTFELREPFHGDLVEEIYREAAEAGYDVVISAVAPSRSEKTALDTVVRERCEAVIMLGSRLDDTALAAFSARLPVIVVARGTGVDSVGVVRSDDTAGIGLAVNHLVDLGHREILHVDGGDAPGAAERRAGFRDAMTSGGRIGVPRIVQGGLGQIDGARAMRDVLDHGTRPTAVVAFNDDCATGVIDTIIRSGLRVPEDVSVVGYDDARLASSAQVPLTTISQDARELASDAVSGALAMIGGGATPAIIRRPYLVVRGTTASVHPVLRGPGPS